MMRRLGLCLASISAFGVAAACTGPQGPAGKDGSTDPSVSAVIPSEAFLGRTLDISIAGSSTQWSDATKVSFDNPKITVNKVTAASHTGLVVNVTIGSDAALGATNITVEDPDVTETYKGAFEIRSPLAVTTSGSLAQGSIISVRARGLDFEAPFDTTATGDGFFTPLTFTNVFVDTSAGTWATVDNVTDYVVDYTLLVDVTAPPAPVDVSIQSGKGADHQAFPYPDAFPIAARTPNVSTVKVSGGDQIARAGDSVLFSYTPPDANVRIVDLVPAANDADAAPYLYFLPKSGSFTDLFFAGAGATLLFSSTDPIYAIGVDEGGHAGYTMQLTVAETPITAAVEKEPNDDQAAAEANGAVTLPYAVQGATLKSGDDEDWIAVTVPAADVGKSIRVQTTGFDGLTDTVVDILDDAGTSLGGPSGDQLYLDTLTSKPIGKAGTYYVKVYASPLFEPLHSKYDLVIRMK